MGRSWRIGTAFGIGLYVHWTFLLIPALVLIANLGHGLLAALLASGVVAVFVFTLFGCVLLHELGHALMARTYGIGTRDITLYPIGGVARLEGMGSHPGQEFAIAIAGPLVNVVIAAGLWFGMTLAGIPPQVSLLGGNLDGFGSPVEAFLNVLLNANLVLVVFNLVPAFPMDGGRMFRALLALTYGRLRATEIAVKLGKVIAAVFIVGGLFGLRIDWPVVFQMTPMLSLIGVFVLVVGQQELAMLRYHNARSSLGQVGQGPFVGKPEVVEPADVPWVQPVEPGFSGFTWDTRARVWIEWRDGRPVGACSVGRAGPPW
jgi:Zn-dependent protease